MPPGGFEPPLTRFRNWFAGVPAGLLQSRLACSAPVLVSCRHVQKRRILSLGWTTGWTATAGETGAQTGAQGAPRCRRGRIELHPGSLSLEIAPRTTVPACGRSWVSSFGERPCLRTIDPDVECPERSESALYPSRRKTAGRATNCVHLVSLVDLNSGGIPPPKSLGHLPRGFGQGLTTSCLAG